MPPPGREALAVEEGRAHSHAHADTTSSGHAHSHSHSHGVRSRRAGDNSTPDDYDAAHDRVHSSGYVNGGMRAAMLGFPGACDAPHPRAATRARPPRRAAARPDTAPGLSADAASRPLRCLAACAADGLVSVLSLILGVHGERTRGGMIPIDGRDHVVAVGLTGLAGLLAGAASMASGEWCVHVRCRSQP